MFSLVFVENFSSYMQISHSGACGRTCTAALMVRANLRETSAESSLAPRWLSTDASNAVIPTW